MDALFIVILVFLAVICAAGGYFIEKDTRQAVRNRARAVSNGQSIALYSSRNNAEDTVFAIGLWLLAIGSTVGAIYFCAIRWTIWFS